MAAMAPSRPRHTARTCSSVSTTTNTASASRTVAARPPCLAARMRVFAAVAVSLGHDLPVHVHDGPIQVDVGTAQSQGLVLPESERQRDGPPGAVPAPGREPQQRAGLGRGQRLAFGFLGLRRVYQGARIPGPSWTAAWSPPARPAPTSAAAPSSCPSWSASATTPRIARRSTSLPRCRFPAAAARTFRILGLHPGTDIDAAAAAALTADPGVGGRLDELATGPWPYSTSWATPRPKLCGHGSERWRAPTRFIVRQQNFHNDRRSARWHDRAGRGASEISPPSRAGQLTLTAVSSMTNEVCSS